MGLTFECFWYDSVLGRSIRGHWAQQHKTPLQYGYTYWDDLYAHIIDITMSHAVLNTCLLCGMTVFLYASNKLLALLKDLLFVIRYWSIWGWCRI